MESEELYRGKLIVHFYTSGIGLFRKIIKALTEKITTEKLTALKNSKKDLRKRQTEDAGLDGLG